MHLKWVNDITVGEQKVGGVLIKSDIYDDNLYIQLGIGINFNVAPAEGSTCLAKYSTENHINKEIIDLVLEKLVINIIKNWRNEEVLK